MKPKKKKDENASRKRARYHAEKEGKVKKGDTSKEVDHKNGNPMDNSKENLSVITKKANRVKGANKANANIAKKKKK